MNRRSRTQTTGKWLVWCMVVLMISTTLLANPALAAKGWSQYGKAGSEAGKEPGEFGYPVGVATDNQGNVYVADYDNNRIQKLDISTGKWVVWGKEDKTPCPEPSTIECKTRYLPGSELGEFNSPSGIAVDNSGNIYVADTFNHRIQKRNAVTGEWSKWGKDYKGPNVLDNGWGTAPGEFHIPSGVAVDQEGNVYVADATNARLQMLDIATGKWIVWGKSGQRRGSQLGEFYEPMGVAVDSKGNVYVADRANHRIQKVKITKSRGPDGEGNEVDFYTPVWSELKKAGGGPGTGLGEFDEPNGVGVDSQGNVYVADSNNHRIQKLVVASNTWSKWGKNYDGLDLPDNGYGSELGEFDYPTGVAVDRMGNVYVADYGNHRIQKLGNDIPLSAGEAHSVAINSDSTVWTWGANESGQLGLGDAGLRQMPTPVMIDGTPLIAVQVAAGGSHTAALDPDGFVWTWGSNTAGQLGDGSAESDRRKPYRIDQLNNVIAIAAGTSHTAALKGDGTVWTWGSNGEGQVGSASMENQVTQPKQVMLADGATPLIAESIFAGYNQTLAIDADGTLWMWGSQGNGENIGVPVKVTHSDHSDFKAVSASAGSRFTVALDSEGQVWTWGFNGTEGALGNGRGDNAIEPYPVQVSGLTDVTEIAAGSVHTLALKKDGTIWAWGFNKSGQVGNLSNVNSLIPVSVRNQDNKVFQHATAIAAGGSHSLAMKNDGEIVAWGANQVGQLGNGTIVNRNYAEDVPGLTFTVTFHSQDGSEVPSLDGIASGSKITAPEAPTRAGYTFAGWYKDTEYEEPWDFEADTVMTNLNLYAKWTEDQVYAIAPISNQMLKELTAGYASGTQETKTVTIESTGTGNLLNLAVTSSDTANFNWTAPVTTELVAGRSTTFTVNAKDGLPAGTYTTTITVSAANMTSMTFTVKQVVNERPSTSGDGGGGSGPVKEIITVDVEDGAKNSGEVVSKATIERTTEADGRKKDSLTFTAAQATQTKEQLKAAGSHTAKIVIPDKKDEVSELNVKLPLTSTSALAADGINLEINTPNARIMIPNDSLRGLNQDVYFRLVPIKKEDERKEVEQRARTEQVVRAAAGNDTFTVVGRPMTIETNMQSRQVTLILPLPENGYTDKQLKDLGIFIEHSDGEKELIKGEVVPYDQTGKLGIKFTINKFSTFTIIHMEGWQLTTVEGEGDTSHTAYIKGYKDGTFKPERAITRAEMAAILSRVASNEKNSPMIDYSDMKAAHWASESIAFVTQMGLMKGYTDGSFKPEQTITRAEMASIVFRLLAKDGTASSNFSDVRGHWAEHPIAQIQAAGIINGYEDGTFRPDRALSRAEATSIINKLLGRGPLVGAEKQWADVSTDHWAYTNIQEASINHSFEKNANKEENWIPVH